MGACEYPSGFDVPDATNSFTRKGVLMLASLVLAASMLGQTPAPNTGNLWNGSAYVLTTFDTTKPVHFSGGGLSMDLKWNPALDSSGGGFQSQPFEIAGLPYPITLEFCTGVGGNDGAPANAWGLVERDGHNVGDFMFEFDSGTAASVSGTTTDFSRRGRMWAINRAGATTFTLTQ